MAESQTTQAGALGCNALFEAGSKAQSRDGQAALLVAAHPAHAGYRSDYLVAFQAVANWLLGFLDRSSRHALIVLDLSPSMQSVQSTGQESTVQRAIDQLDQMRQSTGQSGKRIVFTQPNSDPLVLPDDITVSQALTSTEQAATTDIPATIHAALRWAKSNVSGPIDLWVCSDLRESDWQAENSRWKEIVEQLKSLPAVRLNILAGEKEQLTSTNASITVDRVVRKQIDNRAELVFDLRIQQSSAATSSRALSLSFEIGDVRSAVEVEMTGRDRVITGLVVPIDPQLESGFGVVSLSADNNPADNQYRFVFAKPAPVQAVVVADDVNVGKVLQLALERPSTDDAEVKVNLFSPAQVSQIDWANTALVAWQSELPGGDLAAKLNQVSSAEARSFSCRRFIQLKQTFSTNQLQNNRNNQIHSKQIGDNGSRRRRARSPGLLSIGEAIAIFCAIQPLVNRFRFTNGRFNSFVAWKR